MVDSFAVAVARPDRAAFVIDADNDNNGEVAVSAAAYLRDRPAFVVDLRHGILAWELDDAHDASAGLSFAAVVEERGHAPVIVASGRPGHIHVFVRVVDASDRERVCALARSAGLSHPRRHIRPPLAPHRHGLPVGLLHPRTVEEALARLDHAPVLFDPVEVATTREAAPRAPSAETSSRWALSAFEQEVLAVRATPVGGRNDQLHLSACVLGNLVAGGELDDDEVRAALVDAGVDVGLKGPEAARTIRSGIAFGLKSPRCHPVLVEIATFEKAARSVAWGRRSGSASKLTSALVEIAAATYSTTFSASYFQLAEKSGLSDRTIRDRLADFVARHLLEVVEPGAPGRATVWRLLDGACRETTALLPTTPEAVQQPLTSEEVHGVERVRDLVDVIARHDVWRHGGGLGATGREAYIALLSSRSSESCTSLAARLGMNRTSLSRKLGQLADAGLAQRARDGGWSAVMADLDDVARYVGTAGRAASQKARHGRVRQAFYTAVMPSDALDAGVPDVVIRQPGTSLRRTPLAWDGELLPGEVVVRASTR